MDYCDTDYCDPAYVEHVSYLNLVTSEHADKPKFCAMIGAASQGFDTLRSFMATLQTEFDVDTARWAQLDMIGVRVGLDRNLRATSPGLYVQAPPAGVVPLADSDYQVLLRGKIGANRWDGTIAGSLDCLKDVFGPGSSLFYLDHQNMSVTICVAGTVPSAAFKAALQGGYMQVRPAGVMADYLYPTAPGGPLFGLDIDNQFIGGLDHGVWSTTS